MNDRFKFRVWDIRNGEYFKDPNPTPPLNSDGTLGFTYGKPDFQKYYIIEQCTGLKDNNGNLIYEGDILDCELQDIDSHGYPFIHFKKGVVKRAKNGAYCVEGADGFYASDITLYPIKIIGNVHTGSEG